MRAYILFEIAKRQQRLQDIERQQLVVLTELKLLEEMLPHAEAEEAASSLHDDGSMDEVAATSHDGSDQRKSRPRNGGSRLARKWAVVLTEAVGRYPQTVTNDDVPAIQEAGGLEPASRSNVRSHFWSAVQAGLYERVGQAEYRATEKGAEVVGLRLNSGESLAGGPEGLPEVGDRDRPEAEELFASETPIVEDAPLTGGLD